MDEEMASLSSSEDLFDSGNEFHYMEDILEWIDSLPLNRPKISGRLHQDFSNGRLLAEILAIYHPNLVELHDYVNDSSMSIKRNNWTVLRQNVLEKIGISVTDDQMEKIIASEIGAIENVLEPLYAIAQAMEISKLAEFSGPSQESLIETPGASGWIEMTCYSRRNIDGQKDVILCGREMIEKKEFDKLRDERDEEVGELTAANKILKNQVARLSMILTLKEENLADLTKELQVMKEKDLYNEDMKRLTIGGTEGDPDASIDT